VLIGAVRLALGQVRSVPGQCLRFVLVEHPLDEYVEKGRVLSAAEHPATGRQVAALPQGQFLGVGGGGDYDGGGGFGGGDDGGGGFGGGDDGGGW